MRLKTTLTDTYLPLMLKYIPNHRYISLILICFELLSLSSPSPGPLHLRSLDDYSSSGILASIYQLRHSAAKAQ